MNPIVSGLFQSIQHAGKANSATGLKEGQILSGKILKLYPNNTASVRVGSQTVQAQLEASLTLGKSYLFQVQGGKQRLNLKVLTEQSVQASGRGIEHLIAQLGLKLTKEHKLLLENLLSRSIPFKKSELSQAVQLLKQSTDTSKAVKVLMQIFERQLPVRPSTYYALLAREASSLTMQLSELSNTLNQKGSLSSTEQKLLHSLSLLSGGKEVGSLKAAASATIINDLSKGSKASFDVLVKAGTVKAEAFPVFREEWLNRAQKANIPLTGNLTAIEAERSLAQQKLPEVQGESLKQLLDRQIPLNSKEWKALDQWIAGLRKAIEGSANSSPATVNRFHFSDQYLFKNRTFDKIVRGLENYTSSQMNELRDTALNLLKDQKNLNASMNAKLGGFIQELQNFLSKQLTHSEKQVLYRWVSSMSTDGGTSIGKNQSMLANMHMLLQHSGIHDEAGIQAMMNQNTNVQQEVSLKGWLLNYLNDTPEIVKGDRFQQMIHLLNGIQLTAHSEQNQMTQLSFVFPGNMLGSDSDIHMNVEGRKNEKGEIDPDTCHILFYLDLDRLEETVIDMNIHERHVSLSIYNMSPDKVVLTSSMKESLSDGLEKLGYQLKSIQVHPMDSTPSTNQIGASISDSQRFKGVDLRI
ncbi:hypothetical protein [Thalassobacillus hwangdonensis]|uniref:BRCT domain-containing protein n=1 Tax=Thalassobacillus hwangdonensis TaxID=546108 RepID=A0ABW3KWW7_9BACI